MNSRFHVVVLAGILAIGGLPLRAGQFTAATVGVRLDVLALDGRTPLSGLTREDFALRDNGVAQEIESVTSTEAAHVVVALDVSGSVQGQRLRRLIDAANELVRATTPADRLTMVGFAHSLRTLALSNGALEPTSLPTGGSTALRDALFASLMLASDDSRPAVLILLTGLDTASWLSEAQVLDTAHRVDVVAYPVAVDYDRMRSTRAWSVRRSLAALEQLALDTGGRLVPVRPDRPLGPTFRDVLAEYRQRYVITYTPKGVDRKGWHDIDVRLKGKRGTVQTRRGYLVP
jgi:Ca-activated chloride channel family protein